MTSSSAAAARRDRVLAALRAAPDPMTIPQLATTCSCSEVSIRRDLRGLINDGLVRHVGNLRRYDERQKLRWGRGHGLYDAPAPWDLPDQNPSDPVDHPFE